VQNDGSIGNHVAAFGIHFGFQHAVLVIQS
jgi:hypothetical protein